MFHAFHKIVIHIFYNLKLYKIIFPSSSSPSSSLISTLLHFPLCLPAFMHHHVQQQNYIFPPLKAAPRVSEWMSECETMMVVIQNWISHPHPPYSCCYFNNFLAKAEQQTHCEFMSQWEQAAKAMWQIQDYKFFAFFGFCFISELGNSIFILNASYFFYFISLELWREFVRSASSEPVSERARLNWFDLFCDYV